jgi:hypothetical protein
MQALSKLVADPMLPVVADCAAVAGAIVPPPPPVGGFSLDLVQNIWVTGRENA